MEQNKGEEICILLLGGAFGETEKRGNLFQDRTLIIRGVTSSDVRGQVFLT